MVRLKSPIKTAPSASHAGIAPVMTSAIIVAMHEARSVSPRPGFTSGACGRAAGNCGVSVVGITLGVSVIGAGVGFTPLEKAADFSPVRKDAFSNGAKELNSSLTGFTLIEVMIVMGIIVIVASIAFPNITAYRKQARKNQVKANLQTIRSAIETWCLIKGSYPAYADVSDNTGKVLSGNMPANSFSEHNKWGATEPKNIVYDMTGVQKGGLAAGGGLGWCYNKTTGEFWANTRTDGVNENEF